MSRLVAITVLTAAAAAASVVFWPGHMDADALIQIGQARTGQITDWYAPILDWLWHGLFVIGGSPGIVLFATILLTLASVYTLLRLRVSRAIAVAGTLLIAAFPPVFGFLGSLQRDVWFGAFTLAAYAALARARRAKNSTAATALAVGSLVVSWFAIASRQNGLVAVVPALVMAAAVLLPRRRPWRHLAAGGFLVLVCLGTQRVLVYDVIGAQRSHPEQQLMKVDLAGLSLRDGKNLFPASVFPSGDLGALARHYSPYSFLPLVTGPDHPLVTFTDAKASRQLSSAWSHAIRAHSRGYVRVRWQMWTREMAWSGNSYEPYHPGIDANPWNYRPAFPSLDHAALRYLDAFAEPGLYGGVLHRAWAYLVLDLVFGLVLLRRRATVVGWMAIAVFVYTGTYVVAAIGQGFRFHWLLVVTTLVAAAFLAADAAAWLMAKRRAMPSW